jgi:hypothetical protein
MSSCCMLYIDVRHAVSDQAGMSVFFFCVTGPDTVPTLCWQAQVPTMCCNMMVLITARTPALLQLSIFSFQFSAFCYHVQDIRQWQHIQIRKRKQVPPIRQLHRMLRHCHSLTRFSFIWKLERPRQVLHRLFEPPLVPGIITNFARFLKTSI